MVRFKAGRRAEVDRVLDPFEEGAGHPVYPSRAHGYVCVRRGTDEVLGAAKGRGECERIARMALMERTSRRFGRFVGRSCLFQSGRDWRLGTVEAVRLEGRTMGGPRIVWAVRTPAGALELCWRVWDGDAPALRLMERLQSRLARAEAGRDAARRALSDEQDRRAFVPLPRG